MKYILNIGTEALGKKYDDDASLTIDGSTATPPPPIGYLTMHLSKLQQLWFR